MKLEAGDFSNCLVTTYHLYVCHFSNFPVLVLFSVLLVFASYLTLPSAACCSPPSLFLLCFFPPPLLPIAFSSCLSFSVFLHCYIFFLCSLPLPVLSPLHFHLTIIRHLFISLYFCIFVLRPLLLLHFSNFLFICLYWSLFYITFFIAFSHSSLSFLMWC